MKHALVTNEAEQRLFRHRLTRSTHNLTPHPQPAARQNKMKINDWLSIQSLFDELNRRLDKYQKYQGVAVPRIYIRMLVELDDFLNDTMANKDIKKKMSSTNAKALNAMRQRLKKHIPAFAEQVEKYKESPESTDEEEEDEEDGKEEGKADEDDKKQVSRGPSRCVVYVRACSCGRTLGLGL